MIKENYLKFKISEKNANLFRLLCSLEDNDIEYKTEINDKEGDSIILDTSNYIKIYNQIKNYLGDKIEIRYRDGSSDERKTPEVTRDGYVSMYGNFWINSKGDWYNNEKDDHGNLGTAMTNYSKMYKRGNYIDLSNSIREGINLGIIDRQPISKSDKTIKRCYTEIKYSIFKYKITGEDPKKNYEDFVNNPNFSRCIPWKNEKKGEYGYWIWPERAFRDKLVNYPPAELIIRDVDDKFTGQLSKVQTNTMLTITSENVNLFLVYSNLMSEVLLYITDDYRVLVNGINSYVYSSMINQVNFNDISINYDKYIRSNKDKREEIEMFLKSVRDYGFIPIDNKDRTNFEENWKTVIEMPK